MNWLNSILMLLVAYIVVFFEATSSTMRHFLGAQIDLLPALMIYASLSSGLFGITALALFGGLCFDSLSADPLGITILPLFAFGYIIYLRRELILRDQFFAQLVLGLVASGSLPLLKLVLMSFTRQMPVLGFEFIWQWLVMTVGGGILTPVCFRLFDGLNHALAYRPAVETTFRPDRQIKRGRN